MKRNSFIAAGMPGVRKVRQLFILTALVIFQAFFTAYSYAFQSENKVDQLHRHNTDTTESPILETTHLDNIFLEGQEINLKMKLLTAKYQELKLSYQVYRETGKDQVLLEKKTSFIILRDGLAVETNEELRMSGIPVGTYHVNYSFHNDTEAVSTGELVLTVLKNDIPSRDVQLHLLRKKNILVPTWGWSYQEMCDAAKKFGYNVFNAPGGNRIDPLETSYYFKKGIKIIVRPSIIIYDPFDPDEIQKGCRQLAEIIDFYGSHPDVLGFSIAFGLFGEGGFPVPPYGKYEFSEKARKGFNELMNTPDEPLPLADTSGLPGSMRYIKWMEYRQQQLSNFRKEYISMMKGITPKLVGTWSEIYPLVNYALNMGDAPGADFMFYDLSFGDVSFNQKIAFAETHGDMQHYPNFDLWKEHILPLVAKAYGEGVIPMGFQFPMRRGHAENFLSVTEYFTDRIEDEYALKICPEYKKIMRSKVLIHEPEVAFVYQSYGASAYPQDQKGFNLYNDNNTEMEALLHMMGVFMDVVPLEKLDMIDLNKYKLVVIPDAMYLTEEMYEKINNTCAKILVTGDYLRAYWDGNKNITATEWGQSRKFDDFEIKYGKLLSGKIRLAGHYMLNKELERFNYSEYKEDRFACYNKLPSDAKVLVSCDETPVLISYDKDHVFHLTNRIFGVARREMNPELEQFAFQILKNILKDSDVVTNISDGPLCRVQDYVYAPYGLSNNILWNQTDKDLELMLVNGRKVVVPKHGWATLSE